MPHFIRIAFIKTIKDINVLPDPLELVRDHIPTLLQLQKCYDEGVPALTFENPLVNETEAINYFARRHPGCVVEGGWRAE